jgi:hypothetical protein
MPPRRPISPGLDRVARDLYRPSAGTAYQVMVVIGSDAPAINGLTIVVPEDVQNADRGQRLQRAINGRKANPRAVGAQPVVDLLSGEKRVGCAERVQDRDALGRGTKRRLEGRGHLGCACLFQRQKRGHDRYSGE